MRELNTVESPSAGTVDRNSEAHRASRASFEAALRVTRHHASKFDARLRALQQQLSQGATSAQPQAAK
jgi:hypothetical protein